MLNKEAIKTELRRGSIYVDGAELKYDEYIGENYIDLTLGSTIKTYDAPALNITEPCPTIELPIHEEGLLLKPFELYVGRTLQFTKTYGFVPILTDTEDLAALGADIHITAGFGDNGFEGTWTLEIICALPTRIYPNLPVGRIYYHPLVGKGDILYRGKYFGQVAPTESRLSEEYGKARVRKC